MPEPVTLAVVGTIALTEGIKFLYGQASEVLKRWRERRDKAKQGAAGGGAVSNAPQQTEAVEPVNVELPAVFEGQLSSPVINFDAVEKLEEPMDELCDKLSGYAEGRKKIDTPDEKLLQNVDALRQALEAVFQQRLTFKGENRPASGPTVEGRIDVESVKGYVSGVRARTVQSGSVKADVKAKTVESGGQLIGADIDTIGAPPDRK